MTMHIERILSALDELTPERIAGMSMRYRDAVHQRALAIASLCDPLTREEAARYWRGLQRPEPEPPKSGILAQLQNGRETD